MPRPIRLIDFPEKFTQFVLHALELMAFLVVIAAVDPIRMNFPVEVIEKVADVDFGVFVALNLVTDFDPRFSVDIGQGCGGNLESNEVEL